MACSCDDLYLCVLFHPGSNWRAKLEGAPPSPRSVEQIEVTIDNDTNGILGVPPHEKARCGQLFLEERPACAEKIMRLRIGIVLEFLSRIEELKERIRELESLYSLS
jgi:molecular chaperone DnaK (HSP70)